MNDPRAAKARHPAPPDETSGSMRLGASWDGEATHFALYAGHAAAVELCLFDQPEEERATSRHALERGEGGVWSATLPEVAPGRLYGYRVYGAYDPERGHRHNPKQLLIDPYARAVRGELLWGDEVYGFKRGAPNRPSASDSAGCVPKSVVVDPHFDWAGDEPPRHAWRETLIYECHVEGMTRLHPLVPEAYRGTFAGLTEQPVLAHLKSLGVTALELMPVQHSVSEHRLQRLGLSNYWGYNTLAFFAPDRRFSSDGDPYGEFKQMVQRLHREGFEVILDIALNHTAEGDHRGPTLSLKGIDNLAYYRSEEGDPASYVNYSGCGNTLDIRKPATLRLVLDCLRYWVAEMHVDGFRFDLAPVLGRDPLGFNPHAQLFSAIAEDPILSPVKMIAEPWDLGPKGYRLGAFPPPWREWNDRWRDTVRSFWRGDSGRLPELASRLAGSRDLFAKRPLAGVHFAACHDGFTVRDLVSYEERHNEANGERGRDGHRHNLSRNWGVEGPTNDAAIEELRQRTQRNLLATVLFSQGVPMLAHGDEQGRSQRGNNNAYCQANEVSWVDWQLAASERSLLAFACRAAALRRTLLLQDDAHGRKPELRWLHASGRAMLHEDWQDASLHTLGMWLTPEADQGSSLLLLHAGEESLAFPLPEIAGGWRLELDTAEPEAPAPARHQSVLTAFSLQFWSSNR